VSVTLARHPQAPKLGGPLVLIILDGVGIGAGDAYDAVKVARTPVLDRLSAEALSRTLQAHGTAVGLPSDADAGNSEVGHNILGAGRIFDQGAKCVDKAIASETIWQGVWTGVIEQVRQHQSTLHLLGLLSDGNVHSNMDHLLALIDRAHAEGVRRLRLHCLTDGRDVPDFTAERYVTQVEEHFRVINQHPGIDFCIASGGGRMITTMDRYEADWSIVERGWQAHVLGTARPFSSALEAIGTLRKEQTKISDQRLDAFTICDANGPVGPIEDGDAVVLFNFRGDRAIEISQAFTQGESFRGFDRERVPDVYFAGMMLYDGDLAIPEHYLVSPETVEKTVSEYLALTGISQFACAETQKFGHVTYFWNGNRSDKFDDTSETYLEIPSDLVPFEQRPWMKSAETADAVIDAIERGEHRFIRANFAGGDMVGHTGAFEASVIAVESLDLALARIVPVVEHAGGCLVVTADHGNADDMVERGKDGVAEVDEDGAPRWRTAHSLNPVPLLICDFAKRSPRLRGDLNQAGLANVAATLVELLGFAAPEEYEPSLLEWPSS